MKVNRLLSIIIILLEKKRITAIELANKFEVSKKTIYRDIDSINEIVIPIHSTSGVNGGFEIMPNYKIDNTVFSHNDLSNILFALENIPNIAQDRNLVDSIIKIKSLIPNEHAKEIELSTNQILIDLSPWIAYSNIKDSLEILKQALNDKKLISFNYSNVKGKETIRIVEIYQLILKGNNWYCYCFCKERNDFRMFKITRISNLKILNETFPVRKFTKPQLSFKDEISSIQSEVIIRIDKSIKDDVLNYCPIENFHREDNKNFIVNFPFVDNDYYLNIILGFGDKAECLAPIDIRNKLKKKLSNLLNIYEN